MLAGLTAGWFATASIVVAQNDPTPPVQPAVVQPAQPATPDATAQQPADQTNAVMPAVDTTPPVPEGTNSATTAGAADNGLIPNFRGVPVDTVLKYLADSAGFIITRDTDTRAGGTVDMVSSTPVSKEEIVGLLNKVLGKNGLTAVQDGRNLEIMTVDAATLDAKTPVVVWEGSYTNVPSDSTVVTEIIPLHSLNPTQVVKDLFSLRPPDAVMSANEGGNAIIMTAKRSDVRRFTQIIQALDSSGNGDLEVFLLTYADSKAIAQELKDVFSPADATGAQGNPFQAIFGRGRGGGGFGAGGGGAGGEENPKRAAIKVNAVSDDQNNAVLISAPMDIMPGISNLITKLDIPQEDTVQIRVFHLMHADPTDIVNELSSIFPDPTYMAAQANGANTRRAPGQFAGGGRGGFGGGGGGGAATAGAALSDRMKKQTTVYSVSDARTQSVIVTASKDTMVQIEQMILHLDENSARMQQVYVFVPQFMDVSDMQQPLQDLFASSTSRSSATTVNALTQRATSAAQNNTISSTGSAISTGAGGGGGGGGGR
jgi:type II secretory pathway component GspD/PulD (secretin)